MQIAIIGGGFTGLTAAYRFSQKGHQVSLFEKENYLGGLSTGFKEKNWQWFLENFYHHLFPTDLAAQKLIRGLNLTDQLFFTRPKTSIFKNGQIHQFDSTFSVLKFPLLSFPDKIRTGLVTFGLQSFGRWQNLEQETASSWLKKYYGHQTYQTIWQPLLQAKFGQKANQISMAWLWGRLKKRSAKLGYLKGGFQVLINQLEQEIKKMGGEIYLNQEIKKFISLNQFDKVIFTVPVSVFLKIMGEKLPSAYRQHQQKLKMLSVLNLILVLKENFLTDQTYWLNINQKEFPFVAVVEHTNFVNPKHYGGHPILYVGGYYPPDHRFLKMKKETIFKEFLPFLEKINPGFNQSGVISYQLHTNRFAQPIISLNYSRLIPKTKTPIPNVFLANMQMVYPWDRGINYAINLGERITDEILKGNQKNH